MNGNTILKMALYGLAAGMALSSCRHEEVKPDHTELIQEIRSADKMVFASMSVTKTARTSRADWYKIGKRIAVYSYDSYLEGSIDLSDLGPDDFIFDEQEMTVHITLPPVEVRIAGRDMEMRKEYENIGLLRTNPDAAERAEIKELANTSFVDEVQNNPQFRRQVTDAARKKARLYFENLMADRGYKAIVEFK